MRATCPIHLTLNNNIKKVSIHCVMLYSLFFVLSSGPTNIRFPDTLSVCNSNMCIHTKHTVFCTSESYGGVVSDTVRSAWYKVVRDIVPTTERASKINLQPTDTYRKGKSMDTRSQKLAIRDAAHNTWRWTRNNSTGYTGRKHDTFPDRG